MMWDPISVFYLMLMLNTSELPDQRLSVKEVIEANELKIIQNKMKTDVTLRQGV